MRIHPSPPTRPEILCLGLLLVATALVRTPGLSASLWYDEIGQTRTGYLAFPFLEALFADTHPPLYGVAVRLVVSVLGDGSAEVRLASLVFGLWAVVLTWLLGSMFNRRTAWLAAILLALSPPHIWYSVENKGNALAVLTSAAAAWTAYRFYLTPRFKEGAWFVVACVAGLWTHAFVLFAVTAVFAWLTMRVLADRTGAENTGTVGWRGLFLTALLVAAGYGPVLAEFLDQSEILPMAYLRPFGLVDLYKLALIYLPHGNTLRTASPYAGFEELLGGSPWAIACDLLFAGVIAWGAWQLFAAHRRSAERPERAAIQLIAAWLIVPVLATVALSLYIERCYIERNLLPLAPPFFVLLAYGLTRPGPRIGLRTAAAVGLVAASACAVWMLWVGKAEDWTVYKPKSDWRAAAERLTDDAATHGKPIAAYVSHPAVLGYHLRKAKRDSVQVVARRFDATAGQSIRSTLGSAPTADVWLIENRAWRVDFADHLEALRADPSLRVEPRGGAFGLRFYQVTQAGR